MKRLLPHPLLSFILLVIWLLLVNELSAGHLLLGALLGWGVPLYTARFWPDAGAGAPAAAAAALHRRGAVRHRGRQHHRGAADSRADRNACSRRSSSMPLALRSEVAISLLANTISLTPGTVSAYLSADRRCLIIHSLHTTAPDELIAHHSAALRDSRSRRSWKHAEHRRLHRASDWSAPRCCCRSGAWCSDRASRTGSWPWTPCT